jgi:hypothetical protein
MVAALEACRTLDQVDVRMTAGERGHAVSALIDVALFQARVALGKSKVCRSCCREIREPTLAAELEERCPTCVLELIEREEERPCSSR